MQSGVAAAPVQNLTRPPDLTHPLLVQLRPYQRECLQRLADRYRAGARRLLVSLPTGTGKTVVFAQFPRFFSMKRRLLVLAHRQELLEQAQPKFQAVDASLSVGIEQADRSAGDAQVVIASVPTLRGARLQSLNAEEFYLVVVDEAHHAVAPSYRAIFEHLQLLSPGSRKLLVGFTATPRRGDRRGLGEVFEEIAYSKSLEEMIAAGYLCPIVGWRVDSNTSLDSVKVAHGDFVESQLANAVNTEERNALVIAAHQRFASSRKSIVFCANVSHAQELAKTFAHAGIQARAVWGAMPLAERRSIIQQLSTSQLQVVTNCNVLTEGFDEPSIDCVIMARPTKSLGLYAQMIGRGTRLHPGKQELVVIDIADNSRRHALAGLSTLFGLSDGFDLQGHAAMEVADRMQRLARTSPWVDLSRVSRPEQLEMAAERIEFFRLEPPEEIASVAELTWLAAPAGGYQLHLPDGDRIAIERNLLGHWEISVQGQREERPLGRCKSAEQAVVMAEQLVRKDYPGALRVIRRDASWRQLEPTARQLEILRAKHVPTPPGLTRGQASWLLSYALGRPR